MKKTTIALMLMTVILSIATVAYTTINNAPLPASENPALNHCTINLRSYDFDCTPSQTTICDRNHASYDPCVGSFVIKTQTELTCKDGFKETYTQGIRYCVKRFQLSL